MLTKEREMLAIILLIIGIVCRFVFDIPNFTPIAAIALFGATHLSKKYAVIIPLAIIMISDLMIGLHETVFFTWGSILLISFLSLKFREKVSFKNVAVYSLLASIFFFVVTNFGVWIAGLWYPRTFAGLADCFAMGLPFFRNFLLGTVAYSLALFGIYDFVKARWKLNESSGCLTI
jgi:hypothetical protein